MRPRRRTPILCRVIDVSGECGPTPTLFREAGGRGGAREPAMFVISDALAKRTARSALEHELPILPAQPLFMLSLALPD